MRFVWWLSFAYETNINSFKIYACHAWKKIYVTLWGWRNWVIYISQFFYETLIMYLLLWSNRTLLILFFKEQPFANVLQNRSSSKICKVHKKTSLLGSLFNEFAEPQALDFNTKRLKHRCFLVNSLRTLFTQTTSAWMLLQNISFSRYVLSLVYVNKMSKESENTFRNLWKNSLQAFWNILQNSLWKQTPESFFNKVTCRQYTILFRKDSSIFGFLRMLQNFLEQSFWSCRGHVNCYFCMC